ncbi:hypothetical protein [Vibrio gallaecicus]|uniref:hypothetical protein n=1 Tax=Vibrio gallaecicus TaxID=552386 RepID=UPI0025B5F41B|nr:hypothetical protein [Vibrio gallaecicus]MDN3617533.1 hypothetical protein [Vibrio gallaecicus]
MYICILVLFLSWLKSDFSKIIAYFYIVVILQRLKLVGTGSIYANSRELDAVLCR